MYSSTRRSSFPGYGTFAEAEQFLVPAPVDAGQGAPVAPDGGVGTVAPLPPIEQPEHPAGLHLVSPNGMVVELVLERTLPTVDCTSMYQFFHQESGELEVNTSYQIYEGDTFVATFTTGAERRNLDSEVAEAKAVKFETLGTSEQPSRITTAYVTNVPSTLAFVHYAGSEQEVTYPMYDGTGVATYDFGALECPVVEILGMDGAALDERTLCEPERCMQPPDIVIVSSCGGNHMFGVEYDEFIALPACGATADGGAASPSDSSVSSASSDPPSGGDSTSARDVSSSAGDDSALTGSDASPLGNDTASTDDDASPPTSASNELPIDDEPNSGKVPLDESARRNNGGCSVSVGNAKTWAWLGLAIVGLAARRKHAGKANVS